MAARQKGYAFTIRGFIPVDGKSIRSTRDAANAIIEAEENGDFSAVVKMGEGMELLSKYTSREAPPTPQLPLDPGGEPASDQAPGEDAAKQPPDNRAGPQPQAEPDPRPKSLRGKQAQAA